MGHLCDVYFLLYEFPVVLLYKTGFDREEDENFKSYLVYLISWSDKM